jgi:hypothetical protein
VGPGGVGLCADSAYWLLGLAESGVVAVSLAVAALGGWVPRIVFFNVAEAIAYGERCGSKLFIIDRTDEGDNQGGGSLSGASFCGYKPSRVLAYIQGGVGGLDLSMDGVKVGVGGDVMQHEFR